jgi:hypothetical protein
MDEDVVQPTEPSAKGDDMAKYNLDDYDDDEATPGAPIINFNFYAHSLVT